MDAIITAGLLSGLTLVGEKLLGKLADAGLGPADAQLKAWLHKDYEAQRKAGQVRQAAMDALDQALEDFPKGSIDKVKLTNKITGRTAETYTLMAAIVIEMTSFDPAVVPEKLLAALEMDAGQRELLGRFLYYLRRRLAKEDGYDKLIGYANDLAGRGLLAGLAKEVAGIAEDTRRAASLLELLVLERRLSGDDPQALAGYLACVRQDWGSLLLPLIRKQSGQVREANLRQVFTPLYVRDERAEAEARQKAELRQRRGGLEAQVEQEQAKPVGFNDLLAHYDRFILIGSPGCGKTTLLRRAALAFADGRAAEDLGWQGKPLLPVFLRLRHFGVFLAENRQRFPQPSSGSLLACLEQHLKLGERISLPADFFDKRLQEGGCLVLLDGLDEVSQNRAEVAQHVGEFIEKYHPYGNRFGLSSRPKGYEGEARLQLASANLALAEVTPLDPAGIRQLVANLLFLLEIDVVQRQQDCERLTRSILNSPHLTQIAGTPLFCSALVQVYKYHGADLPQRRVDVLAEIVDLLLGYWHAQQRVPDSDKLAREDGTERQYRDLDDAVQHKLRRLSHVAYYMQDVAHKAELEPETVQQVLAEYMQQRERVGEAERAWHWAGNFMYNSHERSGLLVESNPGSYAFVHQNFMEFLAATALVNRSSQLVETVLMHLDEPWWEQVILLAGAHPKTADDVRENLITALLKRAETSQCGAAGWQRALTVAGWMAGDMGGHLAGPEHAAVEDALHAAMTDPDLKPALRADLADVLDTLWLPSDLHVFTPIPGPDQPQFWLARYPVTNAQYARFLQAEDFGREVYWTGFPKYGEPRQYKRLGDWGGAGWEWLQMALKNKDASADGKRVYPRYWNDPRLGIARRAAPVIGITWYEANAYCKWLLAHWEEQEEGESNPGWKPGLLRLPLEGEWELAAGGAKPEGRYPWDKAGQATTEVDEILRRANVNASGIGRTTPVGMYPQSASQPYGIFDLAGNVWEWQANYRDKDHDVLALRGGSWNNHLDLARVAVRYDDLPGSAWFHLIGFRVLALPS